MRKISKANAKKFTKEVVQFMDSIGATRKSRYGKSHPEQTQWILRTFGGPLLITLPSEHYESSVYTLFCQFEDLKRAKIVLRHI